MKKPPTNKQLAQRLTRLAKQMHEVGVQMDYYGGFSETGKRGREMLGAARIARGWVKALNRRQK